MKPPVPSLTGWHCLDCGNVLAGVELRPQKLPLLHVYRWSSPGEEPSAESVLKGDDIAAIVEGRATVTCSHCGAGRKWFAEVGVKIRRRHPVI